MRGTNRGSADLRAAGFSELLSAISIGRSLHADPLRVKLDRVAARKPPLRVRQVKLPPSCGILSRSSRHPFRYSWPSALSCQRPGGLFLSVFIRRDLFGRVSAGYRAEKSPNVKPPAHCAFLMTARRTATSRRTSVEGLQLRSRTGPLGQLGSPSDQPFDLSQDGLITFARGVAQSIGIKQFNVPTTRSDKPRSLKLTCDERETWPPHPEHHCKRVVGDRQACGLQQVPTLKQPTAQTLLQTVDRIAGGDLEGLRCQCLFVPS